MTPPHKLRRHSLSSRLVMVLSSGLVVVLLIWALTRPTGSLLVALVLGAAAVLAATLVFAVYRDTRGRIVAERLLAENVRSLEDTNRELVEARAEIVRTARLASVGTLAAGIAHEVGNPLGAIMAFVDVARSRAEKADEDTEILTAIRKEARRIDRIVRGLLDYARPGDAEIALNAPAEVVERVHAILDSQGKLDNVDDRWEVGTEVPDVVMDPHRLEQVIINLYLNALDAIGDIADRRIQVRVYGEAGDIVRLPPRRENDPPGINYMHRRRLAAQEDSGLGVDPVFSAERVAVIEVLDNGPGVAEEHLEHLFDPFFTTKDPGQGTGLGLSICARLVESMGGRIDARNSEEGGALFVVRLPGVSRSDVQNAAQEQP